MITNSNITPIPVVYSTPSGQHTGSKADPNTKMTAGITGTQIRFLASPITTAAGTMVESPTVSTTTSKTTAIRQLLLTPK